MYVCYAHNLRKRSAAHIHMGAWWAAVLLRAAVLLGLVFAVSQTAVPIAARAQAQSPALPLSGQRITEQQVRHDASGVEVRERLGSFVALDSQFVTHQGNQTRLADLVRGDKPVVLNLAYNSCPVLCNLVLQGLIEGLQGVPWRAGDQFRVVTLSIDPDDDVASAKSRRAKIVERYGQSNIVDDGWSVLTGKQSDIARVARSVGFDYKYVENTGQYAHPAAVVLLSPNGKITRYLYGLSYKPQDLRLGLLESAQGNTISTSERVLLYCYQYEPGEGYVLMATRVMRLGGAATAILLGCFLLWMWFKERRKRQAYNKLRAEDQSARHVARANTDATPKTVAQRMHSNAEIRTGEI